jgi:transposase-like protein
MFKRRVYSKEFKLEAVALSEKSEKTVKEIALDLGMPYQVLCKLRSIYKSEGKESFLGRGNIKASERELYELKKQLKELEEEREILKEGLGHFFVGSSKRYKFISSNRDRFRIEMMCRLLGVSRSGYYKWLKRGISKRQRYKEELLSVIRETHQDSRFLYGSPRIHAELRKLGYKCRSRLVAEIMRKSGIRSKIRKRYKRTTIRNDKDRYNENLLKKGVVANTPDVVWVSDIIYIRADGKRNYLTKIMDLYSLKVVGYAFSKILNTRDTVLVAFRFAVKHTGNIPLISHWDKGSQYSSADFKKFIMPYTMKNWGDYKI